MILVRDKHRIRGYFVNSGQDALEVLLPAKDIWGSMVAGDIVAGSQLLVPNERGLFRVPLLNRDSRPSLSATFEGADCSTPALIGKHLFSASEAGTVTAVDVEDGMIVGQVELDTMVLAPATALGSLAMISDVNGRIHFLRLENGQLVVTSRVDLGSASPSGATVTPDALWIRTDQALLKLDQAVAWSRSQQHTKAVPEGLGVGPRTQ